MNAVGKLPVGADGVFVATELAEVPNDRRLLDVHEKDFSARSPPCDTGQPFEVSNDAPKLAGTFVTARVVAHERVMVAAGSRT